MTVYLDDNFVCHLSNNGTMRAVETSAFDGFAKEQIEGCRFVPVGEKWVRDDGAEFYGEMIAPAKDYKQIMTDVAISYLDDEQAESVTVLFKPWESKTAYEVGDRRQFDGLLYRCVQAHTSQDDWTPPQVPALWVRTSTEEWPEWVQPIGAQDAYNKGDKVSHNEKHWVSNADANVWEPGVYGWDEAV